MTYIIAETCIDVIDRGCVDVCPVDCIYEGADQLYIHPDECIDCGACDPECPVTAIFPEEDVPEEWRATPGKTMPTSKGVKKEKWRAGVERRYRVRAGDSHRHCHSWFSNGAEKKSNSHCMA